MTIELPPARWLRRRIEGGGAAVLAAGRAALALWLVWVGTWAGIVRGIARRRAPG